MVRAQERGDHEEDLCGNDAEDDGVPTFEYRALEVEVRGLAARQDAARKARLADGCLDERAEKATAVELILNAPTARNAERARPLGVDLTLEVEGTLLIGDVAGRNEDGEADPEKESVPGEEGTIVEDDAGPADERGEHSKRGSGRGDDKLGRVADTNDVGVVPEVKPDKEAGDQPCERVRSEL